MQDNKIIPVFPLSAVILPGEEFYLHIFEPRYKQLVNEARDKDFSFGIPYVNAGKMQHFGSEVKVKTIFSTYPDGEMDISVVGKQIFQLNEILPPKDKLYSMADIEIGEDSTISEKKLLMLRPLLLEYLQLKKGEPVKLPSGIPSDSYAAALLLNFHPDKKYELISQGSENLRITWLVNELRILMQSRKMEIQLQKNFLMN
jgi:Lon protease-like protein